MLSYDAELELKVQTRRQLERVAIDQFRLVEIGSKGIHRTDIGRRNLIHEEAYPIVELTFQLSREKAVLLARRFANDRNISQPDFERSLISAWSNARAESLALVMPAISAFDGRIGALRK